MLRLEGVELRAGRLKTVPREPLPLALLQAQLVVRLAEQAQLVRRRRVALLQLPRAVEVGPKRCERGRAGGGGHLCEVEARGCVATSERAQRRASFATAHEFTLFK